MVFDLQTLKSCGFKVFNFVEDADKTALPRHAELATSRRSRVGASGRRKSPLAKLGGSVASAAPSV